ncbi:aldose epimerase family protein [Enterococcus pallens]|uniref:Aldose 1-epimerase n=1 Tax=Enterococcus pallens ATCC BAA-351 TaxID=1158607 RepID=R2QR11_9ENTE|nr:aldose epimerase family protein [Enterococcus pallens]EOH97673.1 hypothetical protein UAU_00341 [Enterococcus pallens ATCC BAA-351]EOU20908.1 hypothetical protein I588_01755 [Enterococcus pallens ATCC BAA-351]OJG80214.1 hypothetical protein RV10_GL004865 [Enterococcus pallens]
MEKRFFGSLPNGETAYLFDFENTSGMKMTVSNLGATLINLWVPDKQGHLRDVVLGYDNSEQYLNNTKTFFGATIGRNANRIANSAFDLAGERHQLAKNEGENNLHSGPNGFQLRLWQVKTIDEAANKIIFELNSPAGDQGFPGTLICSVAYQLKVDNSLSITFSGEADETTVFNPTNHSYFNLNGHDSGSILNHELQLNAKEYTPVLNSDSIPTGEIVTVKDTPFDFTQKKKIGAEIDAACQQLEFTGGYDHNFVLDKPAETLGEAGILTGDSSGISMAVSTDLPGIQFYSGNFVDNERGKQNVYYQSRSGVCLETQYFPNAVKEPNFAAPILPADTPISYQTSFRFFLEDK